MTVALGWREREEEWEEEERGYSECDLSVIVDRFSFHWFSGFTLSGAFVSSMGGVGEFEYYEYVGCVCVHSYVQTISESVSLLAGQRVSELVSRSVRQSVSQSVT